MLKRISIIWIILFSIILVHKNVYALNTLTHKGINLRVADSTLDGFSLDQYLKSNLGLSQGVGEFFEGAKVDEWLRDGGEYEDVPAWYLRYLRSVNHFYNPINKGGFTE